MKCQNNGGNNRLHWFLLYLYLFYKCSIIKRMQIYHCGIFFQSLEELKNVLIVKAALGPDDPPVFVIPVDNSLSEMTVQIQGNAMMPYVVLQKPDGSYSTSFYFTKNNNILTKIVVIIHWFETCVKWHEYDGWK